MILNIQNLIDDVKGFETVRALRRPDGVSRPQCASPQVIKTGRDDTQPAPRSECSARQRRFDDLTGTALPGHHQPLRVWILCLDFMGLNLSKEPIAKSAISILMTL